MEEIITKNESTLKQSYNFFLYETRMRKKMSRFKFAKYIKVPFIRYRLIELGYLKPSKKDVINISRQLNIEYDKYLEGANGYPTELPDKKPNVISRGFYRLLGMKGLRIALVSLSVVFTLFFISGAIYIHKDTNETRYYTTEVLKLRDDVNNYGTAGISLTGDFTYPQIASVTKDGDNDKEVQIKSSYNTKYVRLKFSETYWFGEDYRLHFVFSKMSKDYTSQYTLTIFDYQKNESISAIATLGNGEKPSKVEGFFNELSPELDQLVNDVIDVTNNDFNADFENLILEKLGYSIDFETDIALPLAQAENKQGSIGMMMIMIVLGCLVLGALSIFGAYFAFVYGTKKKETKVFDHTDELLGFKSMRKPMKKDMRVIPFLPETVLEIIGIIIVALGSLRIVVFAMSFISYSSQNIEYATGQLLTLQMLGMFLLYFIDFDIFADDRRVLRNVVLYPLLFFVIYYVEATIMSALGESTSLIAMVLSEKFLIPNPFFSVTCYYALMMFLFYTPKFIKSKKGLIIYRSLGALPVLYIVVSFLICNGDVIFGWPKLNVWVKYFFIGERLPFSMLAILYLVGLFFLRLYCKNRYGEENAKKYFMGNRFIFLKNIMTILIVVIVFLFDLMFKGNATFNKIGLGVNGSLLLLIPLLLLYHPHKGPRSIFVDYLTLGLYFLALIYAYVLAGIFVLVGLM